MRHIILFVVTAILMTTATVRTTNAMPRYGIERYYYSNACYMTRDCRLYNPGQIGSFIGARNTGCTGTSTTMSESDLIGYDNWKEVIVTDCQTYELIEQTFHHGGYENWTAATPAPNCYCDF